MNAQIAQHLNVTESAILEVQEWARVLWVRIRGIGARFVSKKVIKMEQQITVEKLVEVGGSEWQKGNNHRVYFNDLHKWYGLETSHYKTGNISSATLDGEPISNSKAAQIMKRFGYTKIDFDVATGKFISQRSNSWGATDSEIEEVVKAIKSAIN